MDTIFQQVEEWLKGLIIPVLMDTISSIFDCVNTEVGNISSDLAVTPSGFNPQVFNMWARVSTWKWKARKFSTIFMVSKLE